MAWHINKKSYTFIQENEFQNVVRRKAAILSRPNVLTTKF